MIENVPDDIVCWSTAGDSFIIKQVLVFEEILPSYFNHKNFMSFVRQLNFYGFKKTKGRDSSRSNSTNNRDTHGEGVAAAAAAAATKGPESWDEFRHPQFRRGRRDLLVGIKRQKDGGRLKRKRADSLKSDIMSTLVTDVGAVSDELVAVNGKIDSIMSMLLDIASGQNQAAPSNPVHQSRDTTGDDAAAAAAAAAAGEVGGRGRASFGGGGQSGKMASFIDAEPPAATARGGHGRWLVGRAGSSGGGGGTPRGGRDLYAHGAALDCRTTPRFPVDHPQHGWQERPLHSQQSQQTSAAERCPVVPHQPRPLPPLAAAVAALYSKSASVRELPPLHLSPSRVPERVTSFPSSWRKEDGERKDKNSRKCSPQDRGYGSGGGVGTSPSCASTNADPHDAQPQLHATQPLQSREISSVVSPPGGGWRGAVVNQMRQGLSDGTMSMLQVLSQSAVSAAETEKEKRANSINSTTTQSSFEYD